MKYHLIAILSLGLFCSPNHAEPVQVCTIELPPQSMTDKEGKPDGYATAILQGVAQPLKWDLDIHYMPWARLVVDAKAGKCDVIYTVLKRDDYEQYLVFPHEAVLDQANVLVVRKGSGIQYDGHLEDFMHTYSIGLYRDKAVDNRFEKLRHAPWARVDEASSSKQNLQKLIAGRFDAAIENSLTAVYELSASNKLAQVDILNPPLNVTPAYIAFPKAGHLSSAASAFDAALVAFKRSAEFNALQKHYLSTD